MKTLMGFVMGVIAGGASFAGAVDWDQWILMQPYQHQQEVERQKQQLERWDQEEHRRRPC